MTLRTATRRLLPLAVHLWWRSRRAWHGAEPELALLGAICESGRTFVDVGANLGVYTRAALATRSRVVAIEPHPQLAGNLERLFAGRVTVLACALSDRPGRRRFFLPVFQGAQLDARGSLDPRANEGYLLQEIEVEATTLDSLALKDVAAMKIDVEGHERAVLDGGRELLRRDRPTLLVEVEERHHPGGSKDVFALLEDSGYAGYFFWRNTLWPLVLFDAARHQPEALVKRPGGAQSSDYANNFLFVSRDTPAVVSRLVARGFLQP
jgi:FkbM family methyltransferase